MKTVVVANGSTSIRLFDPSTRVEKAALEEFIDAAKRGQSIKVNTEEDSVTFTVEG
jgi:hypothetical protein